MRLTYNHIAFIIVVTLSINSFGQNQNIDDTISIYKSVLSNFEGKNNGFVIHEESSSVIQREFFNKALKDNKIYFFGAIDKDTFWTETKLDTSWSYVIDNFLKATLVEIPIPKIKDLDITYIGDSEIEKMKGDPKYVDGFWENFDKKFPNAIGLLSLSRVYINEYYNKAIVHYTLISGFRSGGSAYSFLEKKEDSWKLVYKHTEMVF